MHLFEAFVALYDATGDRQFLDRAAGIFALFKTGFFQHETDTLCEFLSVDLKPFPDERGRIVEPGHHYEWVWLLRQYQRQSGVDVSPFCIALDAFAGRHGWDREGFAVSEVDDRGAVLKGSRRTWPHTEALKAALAEGQHGKPEWQRDATRAILRLKETFLGRPVAGGWIDQVDATGNPMVQTMPASTLYHVFCAAAELSKVLEAPWPPASRAALTGGRLA